MARQGWLIPRPTHGLHEHDHADDLVVFVHGYFASSGVWRPLARHLAATGHAPRQLHFNFTPTNDIEHHARRLQRAIERVHPEGPVKIVAHSLGGLIARYYRQVLHGRLDVLVAMGTPHRGTGMAKRFPLELTRELSPDSHTLRTLRATSHRLRDTRLVSIVGETDVLVDTESAALEGSRIVRVPGVGHHGLLYDPIAWTAVIEALEHDPEPEPAVREPEPEVVESGTWEAGRASQPAPEPRVEEGVRAKAG